MKQGDIYLVSLDHAVPITGIEITGAIRCDQPRALDLAARNGRKVGSLPQPILDEVLARTITLFE